MMSNVKRWSRMWNARASLERRGASLVLLGAVVTLTILWLSIAGVLATSRQSAIEAEQRVLERMSSVVEEQVRHALSLIKFFLIGADNIFARRPNLDPRTDPDFLMLVENLRKQSQGGIEIRVVSEEGGLYYLPSPDKKPLANVSHREYFSAQSDPALRGLYVGNAQLGIVSGRWGIPVSYPLTGKPHGMSVIFAILRNQVFEELYEHGRTKPGGSIALVHRSGTVLARAPAGDKFVGKSISSGRIWLEYLPQNPRGSAVLPASVIDNVNRIAAYSAMPDFPLVIVTSSATQDVLAQWRKWLYASLLGGVALSFLIVFAARRMVFLLAELSSARAEVEDQALRDSLTGLPNRRMFLNRLDQEMKMAERARRPMALMFIDLDLFKEINDTLGHGMGDNLLRQAAERLRSCVRDSDTVARLGGDEFTVILSGLATDYGPERVALAILDRLAEPFSLNEEVAYISASIGITLYPADANRVEDLIKNADQAMYAAKNEGRNRWKYFDPSMQAAIQHRMRLSNDLRGALAGNQFLLHYQPVVDLRTGAIHKAEALIRWQHPTRGLVGPGEFISIAEESGMIADVGEWVFREAARQVARWRASIHAGFQISINKSPAQFEYRRNCPDGWNAYLQTLGLPGESIAVEITEGLLLDASENVIAKLHQISNAGIQLSLDDFGTGYSSLSYLKKFDIDYIKIDRSFVSNLAENTDDIVLCEAMIVMAHKLGLTVVAEGLETVEQRDLLVAMGCDYGQGFLFSRPLPAQDFEEAVTKAVLEQRWCPAETRSKVH